MRRDSSNFKKSYLFLALFIVLITGVTFGYAALSTTLSINGSTTISRVTWSVVFDNIQVTDGSFLNPDSSSNPQNVPVLSDGNTTLTYDISLNEPGQFYEFTVDVHNTGTLKAKLESIRRGDDDTEYDTALQKYFSYTETGFKDVNTVLNPSDSYTLRFRMEYRSDINPEDLPSAGSVTTFKRTIHLDYVQDR